MGRLLVSSAASSVGAHSSGVRMAPWPCLGGELTQISRQLFCFVGTGRQGVKSSGRQSRESPASRSHAHSPLPSAGPQASHKESEEALQRPSTADWGFPVLPTVRFSCWVYSFYVRYKFVMGFPLFTFFSMKFTTRFFFSFFFKFQGVVIQQRMNRHLLSRMFL